MSIIKIDGKIYEVGEISLKRDAEIIYDPLTQGVMLDFSEIDDAVATKYRYSFTIEPKHGVTDKHTQYDAFYYDITSPKSVRLVELPFGQSNIIFYAKIKTVGDMLRKSNGGISQWAGLTVEFLPVKPQRYASGGYPGGINQPPDILGGRDTRNKNKPPTYYYGLDETGPGFVVELKQCATIGVPAVGSGFCTLTTVMRYHSFANTGNVAQTAYLDDGRIFTRTSVNDTTTWGAWREMVTTAPPVWYDLVLQNGASVAGVAQYCKIGKVVYVRGLIIPNTANAVDIYTLPVGYIPSISFSRPSIAYGISSPDIRNYLINSSGVAQLMGGSPNYAYDISTSFIAEL